MLLAQYYIPQITFYVRDLHIIGVIVTGLLSSLCDIVKKGTKVILE